MEAHTKKPKKVFPFEMAIELRKPVTLGKGAEAVVYSELPMREPTLDEISQFVKKNKTESEIESIKFMISIVSGVPLPVVGKIGASEFHKAQEYLLYFMTPPDDDDPEGKEIAYQ